MGISALKKFTSKAALAGLLLFLIAPLWAAPDWTTSSGRDTPMGIAYYVQPGVNLTLTLTGAGASQGSGNVYIATGPFHTATLTETAQTVTAWGDSSITITPSVGSFSHGDHVFILVKHNDGSYSRGIPAYIWKTTPTISGITGTLTHGSTLTVLGSNFLTRGDHNGEAGKLVWMWDQFNRTDLATNTYNAWQRQASDPDSLSISNTSPRTARSGEKHLRRIGATGTDALITYMGDKSEYHFSAWIKLNVQYSGGGSKQIKFHRQLGSGDTGEDFYLLHSNDNNWVYAEDGGTDPRSACEDFENEPNITGDTWIFMETYARHSSCATCYDGEMWVKFNGKIMFDYWKNFNVFWPYPCYDAPDISGEYANANGHSGQLQTFPSYDQDWTVGSYADSDDHMYDATRASILISTVPTYALSQAGFETQIPSVWTSTSITFQLNAGAISDANIGNAYLYIVDQYGIVNPNGFQINSSTGGGDSEAPSVNAGNDQSVTLPSDASLDGTVSDNVGVQSSTWTKESGPGTVTFGNANAVDTTAGFSQAGTYVLKLTATDGTNSANDTVTITVSDPPPSSPAGLRGIGGGGRIGGGGTIKLNWRLDHEARGYLFSRLGIGGAGLRHPEALHEGPGGARAFDRPEGPGNQIARGGADQLPGIGEESQAGGREFPAASRSVGTPAAGAHQQIKQAKIISSRRW